MAGYAFGSNPPYGLRPGISVAMENSMTMPPNPPTNSLKVRRLETHDVASYRELRLEAL
jgi:hypothetical protein